jgi:hypothetical protein
MKSEPEQLAMFKRIADGDFRPNENGLFDIAQVAHLAGRCRDRRCVMAIAKEDIRAGWYWVQIRKTGGLLDAEVWQVPGADELWVEGAEWGNEIDAVLKQADFIERIEPPEGV